jgi:MFS-type transporter involved in bile tolerance (Atg22 family)
MPTSWWLGVAAGLVVGGIHALLRRVADRLALQARNQRLFLAFSLGGMAVRMAVVVLLAGVTLAFAPVKAAAFAATLVTLLIVSMVLEVAVLTRRLRSRSDPES